MSDQTDLIKKQLDLLERKDSLTFGTAGKGGESKIYFDAADEKGTRERIESALRIRAYAQRFQEEWELFLKSRVQNQQ